LADDYPRNVAATLALSIAAANQLDPVDQAEPLLTILSLLDANAIPAAIITTDAVCDYLTQQTGRPVDADQAWAALACLTRFSIADLITPDVSPAPPGAVTRAGTSASPAQGKRIRVHALVQRVARDRAGDQRIGLAAKTAADALTTVWPNVERDVDQAQILRANTTALRSAAEDSLWIPDGHALLFRAGISIGEAGQVQAAVSYHTDLVDQAHRRLGPDHPNTLTARSNLARWQVRPAIRPLPPPRTRPS
jgi:hypothetical protein